MHIDEGGILYHRIFFIKVLHCARCKVSRIVMQYWREKKGHSYMKAERRLKQLNSPDDPQGHPKQGGGCFRLLYRAKSIKN